MSSDLAISLDPGGDGQSQAPSLGALEGRPGPELPVLLEDGPRNTACGEGGRPAGTSTAHAPRAAAALWVERALSRWRGLRKATDSLLASVASSEKAPQGLGSLREPRFRGVCCMGLLWLPEMCWRGWRRAQLAAWPHLLRFMTWVVRSRISRIFSIFALDSFSALGVGRGGSQSQGVQEGCPLCLQSRPEVGELPRRGLGGWWV